MNGAFSGPSGSSAGSRAPAPFPPSPTLAPAASTSGAPADGALGSLAMLPYAPGGEPSAGSPFSLAAYGLGLDPFVGGDADDLYAPGGPSAFVSGSQISSGAPPAAAGWPPNPPPLKDESMLAQPAPQPQPQPQASAPPPQPQASGSASASASGSAPPAEEKKAPVAVQQSAAGVPLARNNPFLNKLRSMVDDPNTDELIKWAPHGESFLVPNHVRFGDEVLPRFFKHNRFSSFVRQLNMYGFHKVPHLQQGALKHDSPQEAELWEFKNEHFQRDRPELLMLMARKKGNKHEEKEGSAAPEGKGGKGKEKEDGSLNPINGALMRNQPHDEAGALQLASVWQAIQSIQGAQAGINDNLRHLHTANAELRREAIEQRQRSKKQQDTINKMLRFLAGVFGAQDGSAPGGAGLEQTRAQSPGGRGASSQGSPRRFTRPMRQGGRLLIGDGSSPGDKHETLDILELPSDDEEATRGDDAGRFTEAHSNSPQGASPPFASSRFVHLNNSPPQRDAELPDVVSEATATPGGGRRISQQAGRNILDALASGQGGEWLAGLFGESPGGAAAGNSGSASQPATPGGGFKLDQSTLATLQSVLGGAAAHGSGGAGAPGYDANWDSTQPQNYFANNAADEEEPRFSMPVDNAAASPWSSLAGQGSANGPYPASAASPLRRTASSTALVQSPGGASRSLPSTNHGASSDGSGLSPAAQAQLALTLVRASQSLQGASGDAATVQNAINALVEGLRLDPQSTANALAQQQQQQQSQRPSPSQQPPSQQATPTQARSESTPTAQTYQGYDGGAAPYEPTDVDMDTLFNELLTASGSGATPGPEPTELADSAVAPQGARIAPESVAASPTSGKASSANSTGNSPVLPQSAMGSSAASSRGVSPAVAAAGAAAAKAGGAVVAGSPSDPATPPKTTRKKRAPPPEFEGVLGKDIERANEKARKAPRRASVKTAGEA